MFVIVKFSNPFSEIRINAFYELPPLNKDKNLFVFSASRPEVDILQNEEQQLSGSSLTFRCQVRGYPVPTVLWFKDQMKLNADDHVSMTPDGELHIKDLQFSDNGVYTCEAVNELGLERKQVQVKVEENVADKSLKGKDCTTFSVIEGQR